MSGKGRRVGLGRAGKRQSTADANATAPRALGRWRNLRLPVKLAAVVLVPVIFAVALGGLRIQNELSNAQRYEELTHLVEARNRIQPLLTGLQRERTLAAQLLSGSTTAATYRKQAKAVTKAVSKAPEVLAAVEQFSPITSDQFERLSKRLGKLRQLRKQVLTRQISPVAAIRSYSRIVSALLSLEQAVISSLGEAKLYRTVGALHELSRAEDEIRIQRALVAAGLVRNEFPRALMDTLNDSRARLQARLEAFRATATAGQKSGYRRVVDSPAMKARTASLDKLVLAVRSPEVQSSLTLAQWSEQSEAVIARTTEVRTNLSREFEQIAFSLEQESGDRALTVIVLLVSALLIAVLIIFVIARNLLGSLDLLRRSALDAASRQLPEAVERVRRGEDSEAEVEAVPVRTKEEIGQVARAFDEVNRQALYLASDQAALRRGYSDSFVNVSRRSQSLLERQLRLFEKLEQDEDDPDQLATLFRLDHLATRMRRNNENLMVLSGSDMARRFSQPVPVSDVLRAAVSEIEHYPRVVVQSPPAARLVGYAGSDLVRLMAEVLDNAANFSAPNTSVTVSSHQSEDASITVDVLDRGIGMDETELDEANERLASFDEYDLSTSRRMGLLVIARLAGRHGITVRLHGGSEVEGVRASVHVPGDLVVPEAPADSTVRQPVLPSTPIEHSPVQRPAGSASPAHNGVKQHVGDSGANGARHRMMEGGLPRNTSEQHSTGMAAPLSEWQFPAGSEEPRPEITEPPRTEGFEQPQWTEPEQAQPESFEPPQQEESVADLADLDPEGRVRGLFEPPTRRDDRSSGFDHPQAEAGGGMPEPRGSGEGGPLARTDSDGGGSPSAPVAGSGETATQWFRPSTENAHFQDELRREGDEEPFWPTDDDFGDTGAIPVADSGDAGRGPAPRTEPTGFTSSGLPRRTPREQGDRDGGAGAWPAHSTERGFEENGSAEPGGLAFTDRRFATQHDPQELRGRLSDFQQGARQVPPGGESAGRRVNSAASDGAGADSAWNFSTDRTRQEAEEAANPQPGDYTSAGLPRRRPRAHLLPGSAPESASKSGTSTGSQSAPDAEETRGRLSSFQQGARRGRHSAEE